jgi:hypothetical protein
MSALENQIDNKNFLSPFGYRFAIKKTPGVNYFVQSVSLPSITLGDSAIPTPFIRVPIPGDQISFGDLAISFKVDEDLKNYLEIYNWLNGIGFPDTFDQYRSLNNASAGEGVLSDVTLTILSSAMRPKFEITFVDAFPVALGELEFDSRTEDIMYVETSATFRFRKFNITAL